MTYSASFTLDSTAFAKAASWALKGFDQKADNSYILFEINVPDSTLSMSSVSSAYYFRDTVALDDFTYQESEDDTFREKEEGTVKFAVEGAMLSKVSSVLPKGKSLKVKESAKGGMRTLTVTVPGQKFELTLLENKRPPKSPEVSVIGEILGSELSYAVRSLVRIPDTSGVSAVPALGALDFTVDAENERLSLMATDTYTLAEVTSGFSLGDDRDLIEKNNRFLIHASDASLVAKDVEDPSAPVELGVDNDGKIAFSMGSGRIACISKLEEEPIDYSNFKNEREDEKSVVVDTKAFSDAVKIVSTMSWDSDDIFVKLSEGSLVVTNKKNSSTIRVEYDEELSESGISDSDDDVVVNFVSSVVSKAFHPVLTDKMRLSFVNAEQFFRASPVLESGVNQDGVFILFVPVLKRG